jgi:peptidoglycan-N-acetylglucosamine deacetylase
MKMKMKMKKKKSFFWSRIFLIGLATLAVTLGLGLMVRVKQNPSDYRFAQTINVSQTTAEVKTEKRIEGLKSEILDRWQDEAKARIISYNIPKRFFGAKLSEVKLGKAEKIVALTFDDGPWPKYTEQVLDILKENNIKGTFFVVGRSLKNLPEVGKRIVADGHIIANHTWSHNYHFMDQKTSADEIDATSDLIYQTTGVKTTLFRPPGGILNNGPAGYASSKNYSTIMWSADSIDYKRPPVSRLITNIMAHAKPGGIVLMHDGGGERDMTVKALPQIINRFRKQGYRFVTIPEMLEIQDKHLELITAKK